jgi:hypothetical protein
VLGSGSTFTVTLPLAADGAPTASDLPGTVAPEAVPQEAP